MGRVRSRFDLIRSGQNCLWAQNLIRLKQLLFLLPIPLCFLRGTYTLYFREDSGKLIAPSPILLVLLVIGIGVALGVKHTGKLD